MSRFVLLHVKDVAAEDALTAVLSVAKEPRLSDEMAAHAMGYLHDHGDKIQVMSSGVVPRD